MKAILLITALIGFSITNAHAFLEKNGNHFEAYLDPNSDDISCRGANLEIVLDVSHIPTHFIGGYVLLRKVLPSPRACFQLASDLLDQSGKIEVALIQKWESEVTTDPGCGGGYCYEGENRRRGSGRRVTVKNREDYALIDSERFEVIRGRQY